MNFKLANSGLLLTAEPPRGRHSPSPPISGLEPGCPKGCIRLSWLFSLVEAPHAGSHFITLSAHNGMHESLQYLLELNRAVTRMGIAKFSQKQTNLVVLTEPNCKAKTKTGLVDNWDRPSNSLAHCGLLLEAGSLVSDFLMNFAHIAPQHLSLIHISEPTRPY